MSSSSTSVTRSSETARPRRRIASPSSGSQGTSGTRPAGVLAPLTVERSSLVVFDGGMVGADRGLAHAAAPRQTGRHRSGQDFLDRRGPAAPGGRARQRDAGPAGSAVHQLARVALPRRGVGPARLEPRRRAPPAATDRPGGAGAGAAGQLVPRQDEVPEAQLPEVLSWCDRSDQGVAQRCPDRAEVDVAIFQAATWLLARPVTPPALRAPCSGCWPGWKGSVCSARRPTSRAGGAPRSPSTSAVSATS
jgi:hypothetical protein